MPEPISLAFGRQDWQAIANALLVACAEYRDSADAVRAFPQGCTDGRAAPALIDEMQRSAERAAALSRAIREALPADPTAGPVVETYEDLGFGSATGGQKT